MNKTINAMYFSATDTTKKVVLEVSNEMLKKSGSKKQLKDINFTLPQGRENKVSFSKDDIVIIGVPVYGGRVPGNLIEYLNTIEGNGALAICVVVYGNRAYDDALIELKDIMKYDGFKVVAGGAFIGEHSFSKTLAKNRPDEKDLTIARNFGDKIYDKLIIENDFKDAKVKGDKSYKKQEVIKGQAHEISEVHSKVNSNCKDCKICAKVCPMGSIDFNDVSKITGVCIKCGACVKKCPNEARYFDDENYLKSKKKLEDNCSAVRCEPELFL